MNPVKPLEAWAYVYSDGRIEEDSISDTEYAAWWKQARFVMDVEDPTDPDLQEWKAGALKVGDRVVRVVIREA